jgi:DNA helicase-2/ATP-dependent DNA helicase PcrA
MRWVQGVQNKDGEKKVLDNKPERLNIDGERQEMSRQDGNGEDVSGNARQHEGFTQLPFYGEEMENFARVRTAVEVHLQGAELSGQHALEEVVETRRNFWDDVTVNVTNSSERDETMAAIKQQAEVLSLQESRHIHNREWARTLRKMRRNPYFGRIDFRETQTGETETIYLGIGSLTDPQEDLVHLVYDWRAPISSLYYDYPPGEAEYMAPSGKITGELTLKRQFIIREGKMVSMFDAAVTIGDDLLQEVLGNKAADQMKSIVATIQREQNEVIRNTRARLLVVFGVAGSGKTSVALQRVAYLLYRYRGRLTADQMVMFTPNPIFNQYIAAVLPELGEENIEQKTFFEYMQHRLGGKYQLESPYEQLEYALSGTEPGEYAVRMASIRYKSSPAFVALIEQYYEALMEDGLTFRQIRLRTEEEIVVFIETAELKEMFYGYKHTLPLANRLALMQEDLRKRLVTWARAQVQEEWVELAIELLDKEVIHRISLQESEKFMGHAAEMKKLRQYVVKKAARTVQKAIKTLFFVDFKRLYRKFYADPTRASRLLGAGEAAASLPVQWVQICELTLGTLAQGRLLYEDQTPYLYLMDRVQGFTVNGRIRHVFIDEAQDYSSFQFAYIRKLFPHARFTVLADVNQSIQAHDLLNGIVRQMGEQKQEQRQFEQSLAERDFADASEPIGEIERSERSEWSGGMERSQASESSERSDTSLAATMAGAAGTLSSHPAAEALQGMAASAGLSSLLRSFAEEETSVYRFHRSYRSAEPIAAFTGGFIPTGEDVELFARPGEPVGLHQVPDHASLHRRIHAELAALTTRAYNTIAIICKTAAESKLAYDALRAVDPSLEVTLIDADSTHFSHRLVVIPSYLAKGVEFDAVLVYDASRAVYSDENMRTLFYTVCTRAMHELQLFSVGEWCEFVQPVQP